VDRCVVDEHVELADLAAQRADGALVGDVEADRVHVSVECGHPARVARSGEHREPALGELPGDLQADPAVGAGDESGRHPADYASVDL
jgi:hypothetical protein